MMASNRFTLLARVIKVANLQKSSNHWYSIATNFVPFGTIVMFQAQSVLFANDRKQLFRLLIRDQTMYYKFEI